MIPEEIEFKEIKGISDAKMLKEIEGFYASIFGVIDSMNLRKEYPNQKDY